MPIYEIEQYKTYSMSYRVTAKNEGDAIKRLFKGQARLVDGSDVFIEVNEDVGLPTDDYPDIAESLCRAGYRLGDDVIPSIRSIKQVG